MPDRPISERGIDAELDRATFVSADPRPTFCQYCGSAMAWLGEKTWPTQLKCTICPATREVSAAALADRAEELLREIPDAVDNAIEEACRGIADPNEVRRRLMEGWKRGLTAASVETETVDELWQRFASIQTEMPRRPDGVISAAMVAAYMGVPADTVTINEAENCFDVVLPDELLSVQIRGTER